MQSYVKSLFLRALGAGAVMGALGLLGLGDASAQDRTLPFFRQPAADQQQLFSREADQIQQIQEEQSAPPAEAPAQFQADEKEEAPEEPADEPWTLTNLFGDGDDNVLKSNGWKISGHSAWGYMSGPDGAFTGNGPFLNQKEWDGFFATQQYLFMEKVADGSEGFGWGARADIFYGVDGNEGQSFGNPFGHYDFDRHFNHGIYEWALPQVYGEVAYKDLSVKMGHFYTIVGYEVIPATGQFFFSRQLTFWNSEPFTHTGVLATYKASDKVSVMGGWVLGMDTGFDQLNQGNAFLGGFTAKLGEKTTFVYSMIGGNLGWRGDGAINSFILSQQWTEKFSTVHQFDVLGTNLLQADGVTPANFRDPNSFTPRNSTGLINYAFYDITKWLKAGVRYEWYKADGTSYNTLTAGVNIKPTNWLLIRPEVRGMWSPGNQDIYTGAKGYSNKLFNATLFGVDTIIVF